VVRPMLHIHLLAHLLHLSSLCHISTVAYSLPTSPTDLGECLVGFTLIALVVDDNEGAALSQFKCNGSSETARATGDYGNTSLQSLRHGVLSAGTYLLTALMNSLM